jgi:hypothetical protein
LSFNVCGDALKAEEVKVAVKAAREMAEDGKSLGCAVEGSGCAASGAKKLFREGNKSKLIKLGVALIVFPEPTPVSEMVGASFVAAGAVQKAIRDRAAFVEDIGKDLKKAIKDLEITKDLI